MKAIRSPSGEKIGLVSFHSFCFLVNASPPDICLSQIPLTRPFLVDAKATNLPSEENVAELIISSPRSRFQLKSCDTSGEATGVTLLPRKDPAKYQRPTAAMSASAAAAANTAGGTPRGRNGCHMGRDMVRRRHAGPFGGPKNPIAIL
jgi:hypothetical protein